MNSYINSDLDRDIAAMFFSLVFFYLFLYFFFQYNALPDFVPYQPNNPYS